MRHVASLPALPRYSGVLFAGLALAITAFAPSPLHADPSPLCGKAGAREWASIRQDLVGPWQIEHQAGFFRLGPIVQGFPSDDDSDVLSIAEFDDQLALTHPDMHEPMVLRLSDEGPWSLDTSAPYEPVPVLTPDDVALVVDCDQMDLPRLVGRTSYALDGIRMDMTYRMMVADPSTIFGVMEITGTGNGVTITASRTIWMRAVSQ
ncbi:hypothetical protein [Microbaculum marinisediminis]|uniref:Uncharacterized protein n=1 Tax=Microbaculum marinisediminis TaxID=2931392 RepID=A0AAW5QVI1_9HYPH|nr:hypothetical protein [Microbaculum sp. A6E488]MCT8971514.1 hypothetical protein [Microbaculum sp. A6E488]